MNLDNFIQFFIPDEDTDADIEIFELRRRMYFIVFNFFAMSALVVFTVTHLIEGRVYSALINTIGFSLFLSSLFMYKLTGLYKESVFFFVSGAVGVISVQHYLAPSGLDTNSVWFPMIAVLGYFIVQRRTAHQLSILTLILGVSSHYLSVHFRPMSFDTFTPKDMEIINMTSIFLSTLVGALVGRTISRVESEVANDLNRKNKSLLELSEQDAVLVSILSHDLANHIQIGGSFAKKISEFGLDDKSIRSLGKVKKSFDHMTQIVNEVRNIKATETGKLEIDCGPTDINLAVESTIEIHREKLVKKNLTIINEVAHTENLLVFAEPVSLVNSVLSNILTNAIKFSKENGEIKIHSNYNDSELMLTIRDSGVGIPEHILSGIFSLNAVTNRFGTKGESGTGFGMPILKQFMDKYGGEIFISSSTNIRNSWTEIKLVFKLSNDQPESVTKIAS